MTDQGFDFNGESDLDLQYSMSLTINPQTVTLLQTGDLFFFFFCVDFIVREGVALL